MYSAINRNRVKSYILMSTQSRLEEMSLDINRNFVHYLSSRWKVIQDPGVFAQLLGAVASGLKLKLKLKPSKFAKARIGRNTLDQIFMGT